MKKIYDLSRFILVLSFFSCCSCQDWLEVDAPDHQLPSSEVFATDETAESAMQGIYNQLYVAGFSAGWLGSVSVLGGLSSDDLSLISSNQLALLEFEQHDLQANNSYNESLWASAYNMVYLINSLLEGVEHSNGLSAEVASRLQGEALFVRAFTYFYLMNLYGEIPLALSTDYEENALLAAVPQEVVEAQIIADLELALTHLEETTLARTQVNRYTAKALLARVHLYLEHWELAEQYSSEVIAQSGTYSLLTDLDEVFLANSQEAIWQISPEGAGNVTTHTNEGSVFIINPIFPFLSYLKLSEDFVQTMGEEDQRKLAWIAYNEGLEVYYAYKYKIQNSTEPATEYSMVLRLAEQYLIRAEARAQQNKLAAAITDLDRIKARAGVALLADAPTAVSQQALLQEIQLERRKEFFTEWGHRWLDLKRTHRAQEVLAPANPDWEATDVYYPIPEQELLSNPNLSQNAGY